MHSVLRMEKKFSAKALSYGFPRLDIEGVMPYDGVSLKYACEGILKALVTVELQLCGDFLFFLGCSNCRKHKVNILLCASLVSNNAVVIQIPND